MKGRWNSFRIRDCFKRSGRQYWEKNLTNRESWKNLVTLGDSRWHRETLQVCFFWKILEKQRHTETKTKTWILLTSCHLYFFYHSKISKLPFSLLLSKIHWKHIFVDIMQSYWGFFYSKRIFLTFSNWTVISWKI